MPPPPGKAGDLCIWLVTSLFFLLILAGGTLLVLYITLPETPETAVFAVAGMILVSVPWLFWILTCVYRTIFPWRMPADDNNNNRNPPVEEASVVSPSGERRVRFGTATVITDGGAGSNGGRNAEGSGVSRTANDDASSSLCSHESEAPLALSMS